LQKLVIESATTSNPLTVLSTCLLSLKEININKSTSFVKMAGARGAVVGSVTAASGFASKVIKENRERY
jgi:hypothetical protein